MSNKTKNLIIVVLLLLAAYVYFTDDVVEKIVEKTTVKIQVVEKTDTIFKTVFKPSTIRYIDRVRDKLVYVDRSVTGAIKVNEYREVFKSNNSTADLTILTTGELKSVSGTITTNDTITKITTIRDNYIIKSNLYIGLGAESVKNLEKLDLKLTLDYVLKDKLIFGVGYSPFTKSFGLKVGMKVF